MPQKVLFEVVNRPTKETEGVTKVINRSWPKGGDEEDGENVEIGVLRRTRGSEEYNAYVLKNGHEEPVGIFATRSQAGHAIQRAYFAETREAKAAERDNRKVSNEARRLARAAERAEKKAAAEAARARKAAEKAEQKARIEMEKAREAQQIAEQKAAERQRAEAMLRGNGSQEIHAAM